MPTSEKLREELKELKQKQESLQKEMFSIKMLISGTEERLRKTLHKEECAIKTECFLKELELLNPNIEMNIRTPQDLVLKTSHYRFECYQSQYNESNWDITLFDKHKGKIIVTSSDIEGSLYTVFKKDIAELLIKYEENDYKGVG